MLQMRNMGLGGAERKGKMFPRALAALGRLTLRRYMLHCRFAEFAVIRKGLT
jgi:hypothetical protein